MLHFSSVSLIQGLYINQTSVIRWNGKQLDAKRTKLMGVSRNEVTVPELCINNVKIKQVHVPDDEKCTVDIRVWIGRAKKVCLELITPGKIKMSQRC